MASSTTGITGAARFACHNCARTTEFEQPPCPDGHGEDCPEWYCIQCGTATLVGWRVARSLDRRDRGRGPTIRVA